VVTTIQRVLLAQGQRAVLTIESNCLKIARQILRDTTQWRSCSRISPHPIAVYRR
jgi:hypothetical protein